MEPFRIDTVPQRAQQTGAVARVRVEELAVLHPRRVPGGEGDGDGHVGGIHGEYQRRRQNVPGDARRRTCGSDGQQSGAQYRLVFLAVLLNPGRHSVQLLMEFPVRTVDALFLRPLAPRVEPSRVGAQHVVRFLPANLGNLEKIPVLVLLPTLTRSRLGQRWCFGRRGRGGFGVDPSHQHLGQDRSRAGRPVCHLEQRPVAIRVSPEPVVRKVGKPEDLRVFLPVPHRFVRPANKFAHVLDKLARAVDRLRMVRTECRVKRHLSPRSWLNGKPSRMWERSATFNKDRRVMT